MASDSIRSADCNDLGPVVRTAPNELSFNTTQSWKDIYDFRQGHKLFIKSNFYDGGSFADQCGSIVSERDPIAHGEMRRQLAHAFSQRSLMEQEHLISKTVDNFISKIGSIGAQGLDIVLYFTLMSFDIIGDLGFGETFKGIESGENKVINFRNLHPTALTLVIEDVHPWISRMTGAMTQGAVADSLTRFPLFAKFVMTFMSGPLKRIISDTKINEEYSIKLVKRYESSKFLCGLLIQAL